jgi:low affinity Fe/Cu permease
MNEHFRKFAQRVSTVAGTSYAFGFACLLIIVWGCLGPVFNYTDTWQLVINTGTTIITFLMVFLIQNSQNRDARTTHLKLDELIRASSHARNQLINLDEVSDEELDKIHDELCNLQKTTEERIHKIRHHKTIRKSKSSLK